LPEGAAGGGQDDLVLFQHGGQIGDCHSIVQVEQAGQSRGIEPNDYLVVQEVTGTAFKPRGISSSMDAWSCSTSPSI
jgi:hypothetical protein